MSDRPLARTGAVAEDGLELGGHLHRGLVPGPGAGTATHGLVVPGGLQTVPQGLEEGVRIVFTSSGHPLKFTAMLKEQGCTVVHVIAAVKHARKAVDAGCDAVVAEGRNCKLTFSRQASVFERTQAS